MAVDILEIINRIFNADSPLIKTQYLDTIRPNNYFIPEVMLWLDVLSLTCDDWLFYKNFPNKLNYKLIWDIEQWAFKESFTLSRISEAVDIAMNIEPDHFKKKFRDWLNKERAHIVTPTTTLKLDEPFESVVEYNEFVFFDGSKKNS
jgi:hypothetical protein